MTEYLFDDHYVEALRFAMHRWPTYQYILKQVGDSLNKIGLRKNCVVAVVSLLTEIYKQEVSASQLAELVTRFQKDWRIHLDHKYLDEYETTRWHFMSEYVFPGKAEVQLGRCLDLGCGRGCITANLYQENLASSVVGIDASDFTHEWNERLSEWERNSGQFQDGRSVEFTSVPIGQIKTWLQKAGPFDTILLLYVLHHSEEYWATRTLEAIKGSLSSKGRLIILEDSLDPNPSVIPISDKFDLTRIWRDWAHSEKTYCLTPAYDAQVVLDFVAVQLLAGFWDVRMPCNYRTSVEWQRCFEQIGYEVETYKYIGFPENRDIDVPQTLFVLKLQGHT